MTFTVLTGSFENGVGADKKKLQIALDNGTGQAKASAICKSISVAGGTTFVGTMSVNAVVGAGGVIKQDVVADAKAEITCTPAPDASSIFFDDPLPGSVVHDPVAQEVDLFVTDFDGTQPDGVTVLVPGFQGVTIQDPSNPSNISRSLVNPLTLRTVSGMARFLVLYPGDEELAVGPT